MARLLFAFGNEIRAIAGKSAVSDDLQKASWRAITVCSFIELILAVYGGYFGAGIGFVMLGMFAAFGMRDIHAMGAIRTLLAAAINAAAVVTFIVAGAVLWLQFAVMVAGALVGRMVRSALCAESRSTEGAGVGDRSWAGDERVLFCYGTLGVVQPFSDFRWATIVGNNLKAKVFL